jgi:hypothetical protein
VGRNQHPRRTGGTGQTISVTSDWIVKFFRRFSCSKHDSAA